MIKGVGKQVVLLNNTDSEIFEQAIFILRTGGKVPYPDMVRECERMINAHIAPRRRLIGKNRWKAAFFILLAISFALGLLVLYSRYK